SALYSPLLRHPPCGRSERAKAREVARAFARTELSCAVCGAAAEMSLDLPFEPLPAALPMRRARIDRADWQRAAREVRDAGGRLVALWGSDRRGSERGGYAACAAYARLDGLAWLELELDARLPACPDIGEIFPAAVRMQRAITDLTGIAIVGARDARPW